METINQRLDNLVMFLGELSRGELSTEETIYQANYHIATIDLL